MSMFLKVDDVDDEDESVQEINFPKVHYNSF